MSTESKWMPWVNRFLLFAGSVYYPSGGWDDFVGSFSTEQEAFEAAKPHEGEYDWYHVVDLATGQELPPPPSTDTEG